MSKVIDYFLEYIKINTTSDEKSHTTPSFSGEFALADLLVRQLNDIGAEDITYDREHCYVYATIPATAQSSTVLGFIAHMDTSPEVSGKDVKARIIEHYDGQSICLNREKNIYMNPQEFPSLMDYLDKDLIVTDGTTLLGGDDKAEIAEIMAMARFLMEHPGIRHGKIRIAFTPDEEIGKGADYFDVKLFGADYAYTVDGGKAGELEYENFNAAGAKVTVHGLNVHPGNAKNKMKNAIRVLQEFQENLPKMENPMYTEGYEGFYHLDHISGNVETCTGDYIIRDHDRKKFEDKKTFFMENAAFLNKKYTEGTIEVHMQDSYYNMAEVMEKNMHLIKNAKDAMKEVGINPIVQPIRGGTDGARLSFMGLPCPNIGTGSHNCHSRFEYAVAEDMEAIVDLLLHIVKKFA